MKDLIIVGAGIAGLSAALYCERAGINFSILEQDGYGGGQLVSAHLVENYPGFKSVSGVELTEKIRDQVLSSGTQIKLAAVSEIVVRDKTKNVVLKSGESIECRAIIAATGAGPRKLGVEGEERLFGKGVSYCALCDGPFYAGKRAVVIGGGDSAIEDAIYLSNICTNVTVVHRRSEFRAVKNRLDKMKQIDNIEIHTDENVIEITGKNTVDGVLLQSQSNKMYLETDCVFIAVGTIPATEYLTNCGVELINGYIISDETCTTNIPGIFAAGDIRNKKLHQAITAASDGANAAYSALEYLKG